MKYYGTNITDLYIPDDVCRQLGFKEGRNQYRLVVKEKSMAGANRRVRELLGLDNLTVFRKDYTSETGNGIELELCDEYGEIIGDRSGKRVYAPLRDVVELLKNRRGRFVQ